MTQERARTRATQPGRRQRRNRAPEVKRGPRVSLLLGIAIVILVLLAVPGLSYYNVFVAPAREPVARVNDTVFTMGYYLQRLRTLDRDTISTGGTLDLATQPFSLLATIQNEELMRQGSPRYGVFVSDDEVEKAMRERILPPPGEKEEINPQELERNFQARFKQRLREMGVSAEEYRKGIRAQLLTEKMKERLSDRVPAVVEHAHVYGILLDRNSWDKAGQLKKSLDAGERFQTVARENSTDEESRSLGGDLGWIPKGAKGPLFDEVVFSIEPDKVSDPLDTAEGIWIVMVGERDQARKVEGKARELLRARAVEAWLEEERKANLVEQYFDSRSYQYVVEKLKESRGPTKPAAGQSAEGQAPG
ncbi:MAG: putative post-translocation molecular chaperone [Dehalococcoidia bacterium]|nr:putative post-translocation molecular chaperone [Dehalococcoidia bacterium]